MPINVPRAHTEHMPSGVLENSFTAASGNKLSTPVTGRVRFNFTINRNSYLNVDIRDTDGVAVSGLSLGTGWSERDTTTSTSYYRGNIPSTNSSTTINLPTGYQVVAATIVTRTFLSTTVSNFTITGTDAGEVDRVWYNEWIAEVYQGRDLIYTGPEPVEVSETVGGGSYSPAVDARGGPLTLQHRGEVRYGVEHETDPFDGTGESIEIHFVVEDNDGVVDNLMDPGVYPNNGYMKSTVPYHFGPDNTPDTIMRGVVSHRRRISRLAWFGDYGLDYYGVSSQINLRPGERLVYWVINMVVRSWPDDGVMPRVPLRSLSPPT